MTAITAQHYAGADLLTAKVPGWHRLADPGALDMADPSRCLLSRLCPPSVLRAYDPFEGEGNRWAAMASRLSGIDDRPEAAGTGWKSRNGWSTAHGFWPAGQGWDALTEGWRELIGQLRREGRARA